jgi:intracellular septation protein
MFIYIISIVLTNRQWKLTPMKFLYDYFPIICFFIAYKFYGIFVATAVTMGASFIQVSGYWLIHRRFEKIHLITLALILLLGTSTLIFHKAIFIKWKPSIIYWVFALLLFGSQYIGKKPLLHRMLGDKISMPAKIWKRMNFWWGVFFTFLGILNLYVVYHYDTNAWVNFKLFGTLGITLVFLVLQALYMARHIEPEKKDG